MDRKPLKVRYCSLKSCKSSYDGKTAMFQMPKRNAARKKWLKFLISKGNSAEKVNLSKVLKLCEYHFDPADIYRFGSVKRLMPDAYPLYQNIKVRRICCLHLFTNLNSYFH